MHIQFFFLGCEKLAKNRQLEDTRRKGQEMADYLPIRLNPEMLKHNQ